jgi:hypothetical protein
MIANVQYGLWLNLMQDTQEISARDIQKAYQYKNQMDEHCPFHVLIKAMINRGQPIHPDNTDLSGEDEEGYRVLFEQCSAEKALKHDDSSLLSVV